MNSPPWRPTLFDEEDLAETQRKFFGTLSNTYSFFVLYANIDNFLHTEMLVPYEERPEIDKWIISKVNSLVKEYEELMDSYDVTKAARLISSFTIDQLSNWYVRRSRRRFWKSEMNLQKLSAYQTLYECLIKVVKLLSPFAPFISEEIYRNLNLETNLESYESVHLSEFPSITFIDKNLEEKMEVAQQVVYIARAMRAKLNLKVRQPLLKLMVAVNDSKRVALEQMSDVILDELNIKEMIVLTDDSEIVQKSAKPNFKSIGPKFGKKVNPVANAIKALGKNEITELEKGNSVSIIIQEEEIKILKEDVEIVSSEIKGWAVEHQENITVALDTELTYELIAEGYAREFVNRVQNMRKDAGFEVVDRIKINYQTTEKFKEALEFFKEYISSETLADSISEDESENGYIQHWEINEHKCKIIIDKC
jgi:isoleucyl-tRNA synthetase